MLHPRARVAFEERGQSVSGWILRFGWCPLIGRTASRFEPAMRQYFAAHSGTGKSQTPNSIVGPLGHTILQRGNIGLRFREAWRWAIDSKFCKLKR